MNVHRLSDNSKRTRVGVGKCLFDGIKKAFTHPYKNFILSEERR